MLEPRRGSSPVAEPFLLSAVITAAGQSSRMGRPKGLLSPGTRCRTFLEAMVTTLRNAGVAECATIVLTGAHRDRMEQEASRLGVPTVFNARHGHGRFSSVQCAAGHARQRAEAHGCRPRLLLWPVDCPAVRVATVRQLLDAGDRDPDAIVAPSVDRRGGHPVLLPSGMLAAIEAAPVDANLRDLLRAGRRVWVDVEDRRVLDNINSPADYRRLQATLADPQAGERRPERRRHAAT